MAQKTTILLIAALAIAVWGVSLAGLASLQNIVSVGDNDFCKAFSILAHMSGGLTCNKAFRYWWFVGAYNIVILLLFILATVLGAVHSQSASWVGLFSIASLLYISLGDTCLTVGDFIADTPALPGYVSWVNRSRVASAGVIMTVIMDFVIVLVMGTSAESADEPSVKAQTI